MVSSIGATAMRWRAKAFTSVLTLWPTLIVAGSAEHRLQAAPAPRRAAPGPRPARRTGPRRRRCGRAAGRRPRPARSPSPRPIELGAHLVGGGGLGGQRDGAAVADSSRASRRAPRRRVRTDGAARVDRRQRRPARARPASPGPASAAAFGSITGGAAPSAVATRLGEAAELHLAEPGEQHVGVGVAHRERVERLLERHVALERDERRARCGSARRGRAASRGASAA